MKDEGITENSIGNLKLGPLNMNDAYSVLQVFIRFDT